MDIAACFCDYVDYARKRCEGFGSLVYSLFCAGDAPQYLYAAMRSMDGMHKDRGRVFEAGNVRYAFSYRLHAFALIPAASRSPSAAARSCALGADRGGIALDCNAVATFAGGYIGKANFGFDYIRGVFSSLRIIFPRFRIKAQSPVR